MNEEKLVEFLKYLKKNADPDDNGWIDKEKVKNDLDDEAFTAGKNHAEHDLDLVAESGNGYRLKGEGIQYINNFERRKAEKERKSAEGTRKWFDIGLTALLVFATLFNGAIYYQQASIMDQQKNIQRAQLGSLEPQVVCGFESNNESVEVVVANLGSNAILLHGITAQKNNQKFAKLSVDRLEPWIVDSSETMKFSVNKNNLSTKTVDSLSVDVVAAKDYSNLENSLDEEVTEQKPFSCTDMNGESFAEIELKK